tara:strand:+ start:160 stop:462 length:303 start_codon:yes stop_codon:yes gene_type:complete
MSLNKEVEQKIKNITYKTNLPGFYQFENKKQAIDVINGYQNYIDNNGRFLKFGHHAACDPIYQELSAAIDYYLYDIKRDTYDRVLDRHGFIEKNNTPEND